MKKSLMMVLAVALAGATWAENSADVLVWYLDTEEDMENTGAQFDSIKFWAVDSQNAKVNLAERTYTGPGYLLAGTPAAGSGDTITVPNNQAPTTIYGTYYTNLSGYDSGYSFWMELYLGGTRVDRMLQPVSWSDFQQHMVASSGLANDISLSPEAGAYNFASKMVPEPTGGLLLLMGGALLALRRRRSA